MAKSWYKRWLSVLIQLIETLQLCNSCIVNELKTKDVLVQGPSNLDLSLFVYFFDVYRVSLPFPSINCGVTVHCTWELVWNLFCIHSHRQGVAIYLDFICLFICLLKLLFCSAISAQYTSVYHGVVHVTHEAIQKETPTSSPPSPWRRTFQPYVRYHTVSLPLYV